MEVAQRQTILSPGYRLGCYQIESFLGQGGFGVTYLAHDTMLDLPVAIKEYMPESLAVRSSDQTIGPLSPDSAADFQWGLTSFMKEAQTLARFRHPNIVRVMSVFELNGTAYMIMEYESGEDLKAILSRSGAIPQQRLEQIIGPIIDGLEEVHRHGYIHRDIKPANIRIRNDGTPVLLDFGSARQATESYKSALTALVTAGFAPLEQYTGSEDNQQGPWTDIYALAAVLYYAVTGDAPIDSALRGSALLNDKPDPLTALTLSAPAGYSPAFCRDIDWALSFKVTQRPQSLAQWRVRLLRDVEAHPQSHGHKVSAHQESLQKNGKKKGTDVSLESFFEELDRQATADVPIDQSHAATRTLGPNDQTVIRVKPSAKPANTARFDRGPRPVLNEEDKHSWDTDFIHDRPVPPRTNDKPGFWSAESGTGANRLKKYVAIFSGFVLVAAMLVLLFPSLLSIGNKWQSDTNTPDAGVPSSATQIRSSDQTETTTSTSIEPRALDSAPDASADAIVSVDSEAASANSQAATSEGDFPVEESSVVIDLAGPEQPSGEQSQLVPGDVMQIDDSQASARAVQAAEAQRQLEIERRRVAERVRDAQLQVLREQRDTSEESEIGGVGEADTEFDAAAFPAPDLYRAVDVDNLIDAPAQSDDLEDRGTDRSVVASSETEQERSNSGDDLQPLYSATDRLLASLEDSRSESVEQARSFRPAITDRDMAVVLRQFDSLSLAIEKRDSAALRKLTEPSERKYAYFDYLFRTFDVVEAGVTNIRGNRQDQSISATMYIRRMVRSNGDIAFPPAEFKNIELRSVRNGDWSKINW